jgi:hypothetical protein
MEMSGQLMFSRGMIAGSEGLRWKRDTLEKGTERIFSGKCVVPFFNARERATIVRGGSHDVGQVAPRVAGGMGPPAWLWLLTQGNGRTRFATGQRARTECVADQGRSPMLGFIPG